MTLPQRALPWVASLCLHALIIAFLLGPLISRSSGLGQGAGMGIEITVSLPVTGPAGSKTTAAEAGSGVTRLTAPQTAAATQATTALKAVPRVSGLSQKGVLQEGGPAPVPSGQDASTDAGTGAGPTAEAMNTVTSGLGGQMAWEGTPRTILRRPVVQAPSNLGASGQEVEGQARITVSPAGAVTRVEITRSSGYIELDASVEAALRDYLFSRVDGRKDSVGTVTFRFRLEKKD